MNNDTITDLVARQKPRFGLEQAFYRNADIYERDVERVFLNSWLYAGHQSEIPNVGDYFLFDFADESVIIVRSDEEEIHALLNGSLDGCD